MALVDVLWQLSLVVGALLTVATLLLVGPGRLGRALRGFRRRIDAVAPYLVVLFLVLGLRRLALTYGPAFSWLIDINLTPLIFDIEGEAIAQLRTFSSPLVTQYFMFWYLYGYTFLLLFPFVAYFALEEMDHLRELVVADLLNYGIGLVCYVLFIAYGPRNLDIAPPLLYDIYPQSQLLTSQVNRNVNVFPSLHASLSVTVAALAVRTRDEYPYWAVVATVGAASVSVSTMYLAIHWIIDVLAGIVLAAVAYLGAVYSPRLTGSDVVAGLDECTRWIERGRRLLRAIAGRFG
jgi:membrane-associated phospholipid phosphatase